MFVIFVEHKCAQCTHTNSPAKLFTPAQKRRFIIRSGGLFVDFCKRRHLCRTYMCAIYTITQTRQKSHTRQKKKKDLSYDRVGYSWMFVNAVIFVVAQLYEKQAISSSQQVFSPRFFCGKIFFLAEYYFNAE